MRRKFTPEQDVILRQRYEAGESLYDLADVFNVSRDAVTTAVQRAGGQIRTSGESRRGRRHVLDNSEVREQVVRLYTSPMPLNWVAKKLGVAPKTVRDILIEEGIDPRTACTSRRLNGRRLDERYFADIRTEEQAYWLGFLAADGCVTDKGSVVLSLSIRDRGHVEAFRQAVGSDAPLQEFVSSNGRSLSHQVRVHICCKQMCEDLMLQGIGPKKTWNLLPWKGTDALLVPYWRGMVDGDGSVLQLYTNWEVSLVGTPAIVDAFAAFCQSRTGFRAYRAKIKNTLVIEKAQHRGIRAPAAVAKLLYEGATIALARKHNVAKRLMLVTPKPSKSTHRDWSWVTAEILLQRLEEYGTWRGVAQSLDVQAEQIWRIRKRLGLL